jgi:hypothetical protein
MALGIAIPANCRIQPLSRRSQVIHRPNAGDFPLTEPSMVNRLAEFRNRAMGSTERRRDPGFSDCSADARLK